MSPAFRRQIAFVPWFLLGCVAAASMGAYRYPPGIIVLLGTVWLFAASASVWCAPNHRTISLVLVLASSVAMRRTFLQMIWAVGVVLGHTT